MQDALGDAAEIAAGEGPSRHDLRLPEILDLKAAAALAAEFLARRGADVLVDAGAVRRLGGQCLQVLLAARLDWAADQRAMAIENASPEFHSAIQLFGAGAALFSDPEGARL